MFEQPGARALQGILSLIFIWSACSFNLMVGIMTLIGGGIMEKYPEDQIRLSGNRRRLAALIGCGKSWIDHYSRAYASSHGKFPKKPSDYVRSDLAALVKPDEAGLANTWQRCWARIASFLLLTNPHGDCDFPHSVTKFRRRTDISDESQKRRFSGKILTRL